MNRITLYFSGALWQKELARMPKYAARFDRVLYAPDLEREGLQDTDVLMVPRESNQEILYLNRSLVRSFLDGGGIVVSFGEISRPWLPGAEWLNVCPRFRYDGADLWEKGVLDGRPYEIADPDHAALHGLEVEDLQWHFHGILVAPAGARVLVRYGEDQVIAYEDRVTTGGVVFATTLDPCVHAGYGVIKKTQKFLDAVLDWAEDPASGEAAGDPAQRETDATADSR